jgi:hypothetical protein
VFLNKFSMRAFQLKIIIICISLYTISIKGQTTEKTNHNISSEQYKDSTYYATYNELKELFIKKIHSPSYQIYSETIINYRRKWRSVYDGTGEELAKDPGALKWLKNNWQRTEFKSYEEAQKEYQRIWPLHLAAEKANKEFERARKRAVLRYGFEFYHNLYLEMMEEYPDKF